MLSALRRSYASTSRYTLDDAPPTFQQLLYQQTSPSPPLMTSRGRRSRRRRSSLSSSLKILDSTPPPPQSRSESVVRSLAVVVDPNQISPFLPLITREKNYLLSKFRTSLQQRSSSTFGIRRTGRINRRRKVGDGGGLIEQTWLNFVNLLKYPDSTSSLELPRSHFPSSTRSFLPLPLTLSTRSRSSIELSLSELRQTFSIFSRQRPRTRTGLHRLLIVVELINRHPSTTRTSDSSEEEGNDEIIFTETEIGKEEEENMRLHLGSSSSNHTIDGQGLRDSEWYQLMGFVGQHLRKVRTDPELKTVLDLFSQRQEQQQLRRGKRRSSSHSHSQSQSQREETKLYNTLLHVALKSKNFELFDQVLERMNSLGISHDGATFVNRILKEEQSTSSNNNLESVWRVFEQGLIWTMQEQVGVGVGKRLRKQSRRVLWNSLIWCLAKRGEFDKVETIYNLMIKSRQQPIKLVELNPFSSSVQIRLPLPDEELYSSLIQAYSHRGELKSALMKMFEMIQFQNFQPTCQHFHSLFRSFVKFGQPSSTGGGGSGSGLGLGLGLDWISLSGIRNEKQKNKKNDGVYSNTTVSLSPLSALLSQSPYYSQGQVETEYTLSSLLKIFDSFLSISPPRRRPLPFEGTRTSPSPQTVYFVLKSFETLLGGGGGSAKKREPEILLQVFREIENKFSSNTSSSKAGEEEERGEEKRWKGWRMDKRIQKMVKEYTLAIEEKQSRLKELQ